MSKASCGESRAELWFSEYLRLGSDRSRRKLAAETEQICSIHGWDRPPSERTLRSSKHPLGSVTTKRVFGIGEQPS